MVGLLLQASYGADATGQAVLQPLWAEEGMHRAYAMLRLLERRSASDHSRSAARLTEQCDCVLARSLASGYRSLSAGAQGDIVPCSPVLRDVARDLTALFGGTHGVVVQTEIERINLPSYKRRALVLCASELLINALTHAFDASCSHARLEVSLMQVGTGRACLRVADNGLGFRAGSPKPWLSVAGGLAELLEANLCYPQTGQCETIAEVTFPFENRVNTPGRRSASTAIRAPHAVR
jgi:two-component sensor histidine kinase